MERCKEDLHNSKRKHVPLLSTNLNLIEEFDGEILLKIQQPDDNSKSNEEQLEKLQDEEYTLPKCKLKNQSTVLNHLVDVQENEVVKTQMKEAATVTSLKNELLLLNHQLNMYHEEQLKSLQEKEQLESEFQNEKVLLKELEEEMNSTGRMIGALKDFFTVLESKYKKKSNDLNYLRNSEQKIHNKYKLLHKVFDTKKAELVKSQEALTYTEDENDQLTVKTQNLQEKTNKLRNLYTDKEQTYLIMKEEYNRELSRHQELLNSYKAEEKINQELIASLKSFCVEDLISERDKKQKEIKLNLQLNKEIAVNIFNNLRAVSDSKKYKEWEMDRILLEMAKNERLINEKGSEMHLLQTKITDCDKSISEINDMNNKVVFDLQKEIEYSKSRLKKANKAIEVEKQLQETYIINFTSDQDRKRELDGMVEKHIQLKNKLNTTNNLNMTKITEIKKMQKQLKNKLTENNNLLLIFQKENMETEIAFKREKQNMEKEIEKMEQQYKRNKEENENKLSIIKNEISTFTQENEKIEKERQQKLQRILKQNLDELENMKAGYAFNNKKNKEIEDKINKKRNVIYNLRNRNERLFKETQARNQIQKSSETKEKKQPNSGILRVKTTSESSRFSRKKVTFSTVSNDTVKTSSNESQSQGEKTKPLSQYKTATERLFDILKEEYDREEALKKRN